jgi:prephenate dehydratase
MKIGYLGPEGTFSQIALRQYIGNRQDVIPCPCPSIREMLLAVEDGVIDEAVVPIENSLEGPINVTLDMLAFDRSLKIKAEVVCDITQSLMARPGTRLADIKRVISHPQPIGQCGRYLASTLASADITYVNSTAEAAKLVFAGEPGLAVIGSALLAEIYGLELLAEGIEDSKNNSTRFVVLATQDAAPTGRDKTSIVFSTANRPGNLYRILDIFSLWDINMSRIESRPTKQVLGEYVFFIDLNGHHLDQDMAEALRMVQRKTSFYKFLGSYPVA